MLAKAFGGIAAILRYPVASTTAVRPRPSA
jgi:hypothetical protein